jgi:dipeptidyl-peptidase 4
MPTSIPPIPLEDVAAYPLPGTAVPGAIKFSPDDRLVTYLYSAEGSLVRQLYQFDLQSGARMLRAAPPGAGASEENLSVEEKLRRERQRQRELGVTSYAWSPVGLRLLLPFPDGLYLQDGEGAP